jgi:drug/metabolite transporter (DMT)-like permease
LTSSDTRGPCGSGQRRRGVLLVFAAGALYSTAGVFTRALEFDAWTVLAWRSLFAALFMAALIPIERGRWRLRDYGITGPHLALVPLTAIGTICYIFALKVTSVADVMIVYATVPFVTATVAWLWAGEVPRRRTIVASSVALVGVAVMILGSGPSQGRILGAVLTTVMNVTFALALVLARRRPDVSMTPANAWGVLLASLVAFAAAPGTTVGPLPMLTLALFGITTMGLALALFMAGARILPSAEVALIGISDTVLGPILVWLIFGEEPGIPATVGGALVIGAVVWHLWPEISLSFGVRRSRI